MVCILLTRIIMISSMIYAHDFPENAAHAEKFVKYFISQENGFNSLHALRLFTSDYRDKICNEFIEDGETTSRDSVHLIKLDFDPDSKVEGELSLIPVITCMSEMDGKCFFVAFSIENQEYFKLEDRTNGSPSIPGTYNIDISSSKVIPLHGNDLDSIKTNLMTYFKSNAYLETAKNVLSEFTKNGNFVKLCREFSIGYDTIITKNEIQKSFTTIYDPNLLLLIPLLPCPLQHGNGNAFYIAYYTEHIYFKVQADININSEVRRAMFNLIYYS